MRRSKLRKGLYRCMGICLAAVMLAGSIPVPVARAESEEIAGTGYAEDGTRRVISDTYQDPRKGTLNWREAMVSGNSENGVMESCHPVNDTFIFQNTTFNMPTNDYRETMDLTQELEGARQAVMENRQWESQVQPELYYDYTLHPGHQLRVNMDDLEENSVSDYQRWTDYETAEIGVRFTADGTVWERSTFTSRQDNVTITWLRKPENGTKLNITLSVDDLSDMAIDQGKEIDAGLQYQKLVSEDADYLGLAAHYPVYENSELKNGGFAGITYVVNVGGSKQKVRLGALEDHLNSGGDDDFGIRVEDADSLVLITKSARDREMGKAQDFPKQTDWPLVQSLIADTKAVAEKGEYQTDGAFDYTKALLPHQQQHGAEFNKVKFELAGDEGDDSLTNEALIQKQRSSNRLNHAMLERAFYAGRYAQICTSGYSTSRLSGMWIGTWNGYWQADYTTDANVNLQISGVNIGNMPKASEGYLNFLLRIMPDFEKNAEKVYGMQDAIMAPPRTDGDRGNLVHFAKEYPFNYWNAGASWLLLPVYEYWQCFGNQQIPLGKDIDLNALSSVLSVDDEALTESETEQIREKGYFDLEQDLLLPLLTKQANFWEQIVDPRYYVSEDGYKQYDGSKTSLKGKEKYLILPGYSPENSPSNTWIAISANSTMDIAAARSGLDMTIALEKAVQRPGYEQEIEKWQNLKEQLPEYQYDSDGSLKEWALKDYAEQNNHRHVSHMYGIWPAHDGAMDAKLSEGAKKALENRKRYNTGDDNASHGWLHQGLTEARLKNAQGVTDSLLPLFTGSKLYYSSMMTNHDRNRDSAYCTDALITIPAIILESLAYSDTGKIELLPALPEDWKKGSITGMMSRTRAVIESLNWDMESGEVVARIRSDADQSIELSCNMDSSGAEIIEGNGEILYEQGTVRLDLKAGEAAVVKFVKGSVSDGTYQINAEGSSLGAEDTGVVLEPSSDALTQKWNLLRKGIGRYTVTNVETGLALAVSDGKVIQKVMGDLWRLDETPQGYGLVTQDGLKAAGAENGTIILKEPENAVLFQLQQQEDLEANLGIGAIVITGPEAVENGESVQLGTQVETSGGIQEDLEMIWRVSDKTGSAQISKGGVLTAQKTGTVIVQASPKKAPGIVQKKEIVVQKGVLDQDRLAGTVFGREDSEWERLSPPSLAFDGDVQTGYDGQDGGYAGLKLSGRFYLEGFRYVTKKDQSQRWKGVQIQGSNDKRSWDTLYTMEKGFDNPVYNGVWFENLEEEARPEKPYLYYRVYSGQSQYCNVGEIEFYGRAEKAIDGLTNLIWQAEKIRKEEFEQAGVAILEKELQAAKRLTEKDPQSKIEEARAALKEALNSLKRPVMLYNNDSSVTTSGYWEEWGDDRIFSDKERYTQEPGATFNFRFTGTGFEMMGNKNPGLGYVKITVDGQSVSGGDEVSMYDPETLGYQKKSIFRCTGLEWKEHTVTIELSDKNNPEGQAPKMSIDAFYLFQESQEPEVPTPDKTKLRELLEKAKELEEEKYTAVSWKKFGEAYEEALKAESEEKTSQEAVDSAVRNLTSAMESLLTVKSVLEAGIQANLVPDASAGKYTQESFDNYQKALLAARQLLSQGGFTEDEAANAISRLKAAREGLRIRPVERPAEKPIPGKGTIVKAGNAKYKILKSAKKNGTVCYLKPAKTTYKKVTIPSTIKLNGYTFKVTEIGYRAFYRNRKLESVRTGKYVTLIGMRSFEGCPKLQSVTLGQSVKTIEKYAFKDDRALSRVTVESKVLKNVKTKAFSNTGRKTLYKVPSSRYKSYRKIFWKAGVKESCKFIKY